jgi:hypothetical protein
MGYVGENPEPPHQTYSARVVAQTQSGIALLRTEGLPGRDWAKVRLARKTADPVRQFITSGTEDQQVPDVSIFRPQLVHGLASEADLDRDGYITGSELGLFLETGRSPADAP